MTRICSHDRQTFAEYGPTRVAQVEHARMSVPRLSPQSNASAVEAIQGSCEYPGENCNILHPQNDTVQCR
jgi:hypothetical protein